MLATAAPGAEIEAEIGPGRSIGRAGGRSTVGCPGTGRGGGGEATEAAGFLISTAGSPCITIGAGACGGITDGEGDGVA